MNYVAEINAFERWLESNFLPANAQLLWYKLFMLNNRAGWAEWLVVDNRRLGMAIQAGSENTFIRARDKLVESGLIEYRKGKKGYPNRYRMIRLSNCTSNNEVQTEVYTEVQTEVYTEVQTNDINKLNSYPTDTRKETKRKTKNVREIPTEPDIDAVLFAHCADDAECRRAFDDFFDMRKRIKKPLTPRAVKLLINELNKLSQDKAMQIRILDQSTLHNWQGVFALKDNVIAFDPVRQNQAIHNASTYTNGEPIDPSINPFR